MRDNPYSREEWAIIGILTVVHKLLEDYDDVRVASLRKDIADELARRSSESLLRELRLSTTNLRLLTTEEEEEVQ